MTMGFRALLSTVAGRRAAPGSRRALRAEIDRLRREVARSGRRLAEAERERAALRQAQRDLITGLSHELRTPLAAIRAAAEALDDGVAASPEKYTASVVHQSRRLDRVAGDLFELAKAQSRAGRVDRTVVPVGELLDSALATALSFALERGVRLRQTRPEPELTVAVDIAVLTRALTNVVLHAVRHTSAGGQVTVLVTGTAGDVEIVVDDACGGLPSGEPLGAAEPGEAALSVTRGLVRQHGGDLLTTHAPGGCRFSLRLPA
ncbi:histidine kinase dimerization/phospho-acceptor domain-containing protein [Amycolatopsis sp. NPDC058986]|uniref:sensor histidine kinase n=1 Tax=unclassified Amycolatopsis TaxID=2618356 RepID=UPI003670F468